MASGTIQIVEPVACHCRCFPTGLVTLRAHDGPVRTSEGESRGLVLGECEGGRRKAPHRVAGLALA